MKLYNYLNSKISIIGALILVLGLTSCGSYQYASYDNDGIYGEPDKNYAVKNVEYQDNQEAAKESDNSTYYKNYFKEKATEIENMNAEGMIFTDIDAYQGNYDVENDSLSQENYAGWGYSDNITVNIYNRPLYNDMWFNGFYGFNGWYNHWDFGYGFFNDFWYSPFYVGWNRPWRYGFGWGYPYNFGYPYYGYNNFYYGNIYNRRTLAYSASRRGGLYANNGTSGISSRRSGITSSNRRSSINSRTTNLRNNATRSSNSRVNATRSSNSRVNSQSRPTRSSRVGTRSSTTRSGSATTRSSRSSTTRSSSTRSSTTRSSSTRSNSSSSRRSNNVSSSTRSSSNNSSARSSSNSSRRNN